MRRRGVSRILEALFAAILIIEAAYIAYFMMLPPNPTSPGESVGLARLGYSILSSIAVDRGFDRLIFDSTWNVKPDWENELKVMITNLLPPNIVFNLSIYNITAPYVIFNDTIPTYEQFVNMSMINDVPISNAQDPNIFVKIGETTQIAYLYTTMNPRNRRLQVYVVVMELGVLRGA